MKISRYFLPTFVFAWLVASLAAAADQPAVARLLKVSGDYILLDPQGQERQLDGSRQLYEGEVLQTADGTTGVILFSTGTVVTVRPETVLKLERMRQEEVDEAAALKAKREINQSDVQINLYYGSVISDVKRLREDSNYEVHTPLGTAGVRGTTFGTLFMTPNYVVPMNPSNVINAFNGGNFWLPGTPSVANPEVRPETFFTPVVIITTQTGTVHFVGGGFGSGAGGGTGTGFNISGGQSGVITAPPGSFSGGNTGGTLNYGIQSTPRQNQQQLGNQLQQGRNVVSGENPDTNFSDDLPAGGDGDPADGDGDQSPSNQGGDGPDEPEIENPDLPATIRDLTN